MLACLPTPYPDELLYSVIARYFIHAGIDRRCNSGVAIFGHITALNPGLPSFLDEVAARTFPFWGMTGSEIAERMTLFPYYARYATKERREQYRQGLCKGSRHVHTCLGSVPPRIGRNRFLRFCPACRAADIAKFGETYWHRAHQLTGVLVCVEHEERLLDSRALFRPVQRYYDDATASTADIEIGVSAPRDDMWENVLKIGRRCYEMLHGPIAAWDNCDLADAYYRAAIERGFSERAMGVDQCRLGESFVSTYGDALLDRLGCVIANSDRNWLRRILQANVTTFHPLEHALVQIFLEKTPIDCPEAKSSGSYPERKVLAETTQQRSFA